MQANVLVGLYAKVFRVSCIILFFITSFVTESQATHFRYGYMSWSRSNDVTRTVTFTINQSWRRSYPLWPGANPGQVINTGTLDFGDGTADANINLLVTSIDVAEDWVYGTATITHTYTGVATNFIASSESCCRLSATPSGPQNNGDGNYRSETTVRLLTGNTGSPVSTLPPIINLAIGNPAASFTIPVNDPDGSAMTFALATAAQAASGGAYTQPPGMTVHPTTGVVTFSTAGRSSGQMFNGAVVITDASGSKSMVDFILKMVPTSNPPQFDYSVTPISGTNYSVSPGTTLNFNVKAFDNDPGDVVTLTAVGLQAGMTLAPPVSGNPVTRSFSWTPTGGQLGIYIVNFTAQDVVGVQANTTVTINVNTNPVFIVPPTPVLASTRFVEPGNSVSDIIQATNPDPSVNTQIISGTIPSGASLTNSLPTAFSLVPTTTMNWTPTPSDFGINTISFTANDVNSKTTSHSYTLIVNSLPVFTSTPITSAIVGQLYTYNVVATDADVPFGDDLETVLHLTTLPSWLSYVNNGDGTGTLSGTPTLADLGSSTINFLAEDIYHHFHADVIQTFSVNVLGVPPTISCPADISVSTDPNQCSTMVNFLASATGVPTPTISYSAVSGSLFSVGIYTVTATASNGVGNDASCTFTITVNDNQVPSITCPSPISVSNDAGQCGALVNYVVGTSDNCNTGSSSNSYVQSSCTYAPADMNGSSFIVSGDDFMSGANAMPFNFSLYGNSFSSFYASTNGFITFNSGIYNGCCQGLTFPRSDYPNTIALGWTDWITTVTQKVFGSAPNRVLVIQWTGGEYAGSGNVLGQIALHEGSNEIQLTTTNINVSLSYHVITQGLNKNGTTAHPVAGRNSQLWSATNECISFSPGLSPVLVSGIASGGFFPIGTTTNTYSVSDLAGNTATCSFDVTVSDTENPVVTCPANATVNCQDDNTSAATGVATATDNCPMVTVSQSETNTQDANPANIGHYNYSISRTWKATDAAGNTSECVQTIYVQDVSSPSISCPIGVTLNCEDDNTSSATGVANGIDNCSAVSISESQTSSQDANPANIGHYNYAINRTWTATDVSGNSSTCMQTIIVQDVHAPAIDCPDNITVNNDANMCGAVVNFEATATDNCSDVSISYSPNSGSFFNVGTTTVTATATDVSGNSSSCDFTITVNDNENPSANCQNFTLNLSGGTGSITPSNVDNNSSDNCGIDFMTVSPNTFTCANAGDNMVTLTVTDIHGNSSSCTAVVTVQYQPSCSITVIPSNAVFTGGNPNNIYLGYGPQSAMLSASATGGSGFTYSWSPSTALSNPNIANPVFAPTATGSTTYTVTITNSNGCSTQCEVTMCVIEARASGKGNQGKVLLCHVPPGNPNNPQSLSISASAVPAHLINHSGDRLGTCDVNCGTQAKPGEIIGSHSHDEHGDMELLIYPNPSTTYFTILLETVSEEMAQADIYDMVGKKILSIENLLPNTPYEVKNDLPTGVYLVKVNQNGVEQTMRFIKQD